MDTKKSRRSGCTWYDAARNNGFLPVVLPEFQHDAAIAAQLPVEYCCQRSLNLYDSPALERLATQAIAQRHLRVSPENAVSQKPESPESVSIDQPHSVQVYLREDHYPGWLAVQDLVHLVAVNCFYQPQALSRSDIEVRIPGAIAFTHAALNCPNEYLWGGTVGPDFDCSGLMQTAFAAMGVWLPRDAYQQEAFTQPVSQSELQPGDLVFFGSSQKATHVGLYLGDQRYIHSSGKDQGNNGIAIDRLTAEGNSVSRAYYAQLRGFGRIVAAYMPPILPSAERLSVTGSATEGVTL
jgi:NlpC/P60 family/Bacterial dipeptidyl-peptidase Sh3 domain